MSGTDRLGGRKTLKVSGFLEEFEKDEVKKRVDIVGLFESFGVKLTRKGKSYTGICPWHDDKNPSLSVDRDKGLYNCFGCGESGDVVSLVERMKGVGFTEALEYLKKQPGGIQRAPSGTKPAEKMEASAPDPRKVAAPPPAPSQTILPSSSAPKKEPLTELTLRTVAEYYHKRLYSSREAKGYLERRGIGAGELLGRFGVGFADGSIISKISNGQKEKLKSLSVLRDSGREHFHNCITVPLHDNSGSIVGLYGRKIKDNGKLKHLYLKGPHRGIFNCKASTVYDEIILTESILDALSLLSLGVQNVQSLYGTNGLTEEHLAVLKAERVKTVILALDNDEAGMKASERLKEKLVEEGFSVKQIFPSAKDWNEALLSGVNGENIRALIDQAPLTGPARITTGIEIQRRGTQYVAVSGGIRYRLVGVKPLFVSSLRVNIRAEYEGSTYLDNVDLYSARSRSSFSAALAHLFGVEGMRIENDLLALVDYLEAERDRELDRRSNTESRELTEEERALGLELLQSPDLFERITTDLETLGYVGESLNKQLLYIAASSRKMADPISVLILSQSASGKSLLVETVRRLMPEEEVVSVSSLSDQALNYLPEGGLVHKFLILGEAVHSEVVEHQIREMLSSHELSRLVTMKDPKTGEMSTRTVRSPVAVSAVMSSTANELNPENASRAFVINIDETQEQTRKIHSSQRAKYSLARHSAKRKLIPRIVAAHQAAQRLLTPRIIVNPYAEKLVFPDTLMRTRRDHERFVDLIAAVCFLRQYRKQEKEEMDPATGDSLRYIECDLDDYSIAYRIMRATLPATLSSFPPSACELYEAVRELLRQKALSEGLKVTEVSVSQREIREATEFNQRWIKRYMQVLTDWEYLHAAGLRRRGSRNAYRLVADEPVHLIDLSMIPGPEQMEGKSNG